MFLTFEGLDFSGKTTQARLVVEKLKIPPSNSGISPRTVQFIREPGGTRISERLRDILLDKKNLELNQMTELLLFSASRAQLVEELILPALRRGETVVCDRYYDSTTAYQGFGRGLDLATIRQINAAATFGLNTDLTVLVDIPVPEIERRKALAGLSFDRMESSGRPFYEKVRNGYREIASAEPGRFIVVDGLKPVQELEQEIWNAVRCRENSHTPTLGGGLNR
ncbi:dTMP kinase [bacterium]|nr:MAG: dTMP kinase [bacterium]